LLIVSILFAEKVKKSHKVKINFLWLDQKLSSPKKRLQVLHSNLLDIQIPIRVFYKPKIGEVFSHYKF